MGGCCVGIDDEEAWSIFTSKSLNPQQAAEACLSLPGQLFCCNF
jgi:hypothetical protein